MCGVYGEDCMDHRNVSGWFAFFKAAPRVYHPANSFNSSCTNLTCPISTHADCKSMNLTYQLRCTECNAFYIGEIHSSLPNRMNGHRFITTVSNSDLPVAIHTQSHQIPFQGCWSLSVVHKLADSTPDHIHRLFETAYQFILQSCHIPDSMSINPPIPPSPQQHLQSLISLFYSTAEEGHNVSRKFLLRFLTINSLWTHHQLRAS